MWGRTIFVRLEMIRILRVSLSFLYALDVDEGDSKRTSRDFQSCKLFEKVVSSIAIARLSGFI